MLFWLQPFSKLKKPETEEMKHKKNPPKNNLKVQLLTKLKLWITMIYMNENLLDSWKKQLY